jgi:hypothetical protein
LAGLIAMAANAMAVMVALSNGGNQSAARPVMCFQVISLLLAATPQRVPRKCQIPWSGEGHRETNDRVAMAAPKLPQRAVA